MSKTGKNSKDFLAELDLSAMASATPGFVLKAFRGGDEVLDVEWGETWQYYDLASLTKIIVTNSLLTRAFSRGDLIKESCVGDYLPWWNGHRVASGTGDAFKESDVIVGDLMRHRAGFYWWRPYYQMIDERYGFEERLNKLKESLSQEVLQSPPRARYSDLDYLLLGLLLSEAGDDSLDQLWNQFCQEAALDQLFFHPHNRLKYSQDLYAPSYDIFCRHRELQGEVHDANCWFFGGVTGHAGLFGSIEGLSQWVLRLRSAYLGEASSGVWATGSVAWRDCLRRATPLDEEDWAWGWMMPSPKKASCGQYFTLEKSFGHTGFTGTSLWWDVEKDWIVILLANRFRPDHDNNLFAKWRPHIHDVAYKVVFS